MQYRIFTQETVYGPPVHYPQYKQPGKRWKSFKESGKVVCSSNLEHVKLYILFKEKGD